jgi:hypothetical protein
MRVRPGFLLVLCGLSIGAGCGRGSGEQDDTGASDSGTGASPSGGQSGGSQSGGSAGSPSDAGATSGGAGGSGGAPGGGTGGGNIGGAGGAADSGAGGTAGPWDAWPDWVPACVSMRAQLCSLCSDPECVTCVYGSDEEIEQTGVVCDDSEENYRHYCSSCSVGASCPPCREEWRG